MSLVLRSTGVVNEVYTVGSDPTSGKIDYGTTGVPADLSGATLTGMMQIEFTNLQPVVSVVPVSADLIVNANNADNTISYSQGPNLAALAANTGLVAVDDNETIEFANKTVLTLKGLAGNDTINLQHTAAAVPTGLTFINVLGGIGSDFIDGSGSTTATPLLLFGGDDDDTLIGGLGIDSLYGERGNDTLVDSPGNDEFNGGNTLSVAAGFPVIPAGTTFVPPVADPITATSGFDTLVIRGTPGNDIIGVTQGTASAVAGATIR